MSRWKPEPEEVEEAERTLCLTNATRSERGVAVAYKFLSTKAHSDSRQVDNTRGLDFVAINEARNTLKAASEHNVQGWNDVWNSAKQARDAYEKMKWEEITENPSPTEKKNQSKQKKDDKKPQNTNSTKSRTSSNVGSKHNDQMVVRTKTNGKNTMPTKSGSANSGKELVLIKEGKSKSGQNRSEFDSPLKTDPEEEKKARLKKIMEDYDASITANLKSKIENQYKVTYPETSTGVLESSSKEKSDDNPNSGFGASIQSNPNLHQPNKNRSDETRWKSWAKHYANPAFNDRTKSPTVSPYAAKNMKPLTEKQVRNLYGVDLDLVDKAFGTNS